MVIGQVLNITLQKYSEAKYLIKLAPQTENYYHIGAYFTKLGFENYGKAKTYNWSNDIWQPMRLNVDKN